MRTNGVRVRGTKADSGTKADICQFRENYLRDPRGNRLEICIFIRNELSMGLVFDEIRNNFLMNFFRFWSGKFS